MKNEPIKDKLFIKRKKSKTERIIGLASFIITSGFLLYLLYAATFIPENAPDFNTKKDLP